MKVRFWLVVPVVATLGLGTGAKAQAGQLVLTPRWRLTHAWLGTANGPLFSSVVANSRYVAFITFRGFGASWPSRPKTVLIDRRTGKQRVLTRSPCGGEFASELAIGGPWLMCTVSPVSAWLYNLQRGTWTSLQTPCPGELCGQVAVGTYWAKVVGVSHGVPGGPASSSVELVNIQTGSVVDDPATPGGSINDDLSSADGQQSLCPPLRYPGGGLVRSVAFYGRFALATSAAPANTEGVAYLQACTSQLNLRLGTPWAASTQAVLWSTSPGSAGPYSLKGLFLPSLRHFTIRLPRDLTASISTLALSGRLLYVGSNTGHLWVTELPARG